MNRTMHIVQGASKLIFAAYLGALVAGPAPWGFGGAISGESGAAICAQPFLVALPVLAWVIVGVIGGRRLGPVAAVLGIVLMEWHFLLAFFLNIPWRITPFAVSLLIGLLVAPAALSALGASISAQWRFAKALNQWHYMPALAVGVLVMLTYTNTLGPVVALQALESRSAMHCINPREIKAHAAGGYVAVEGYTSHRGGTYYTDPTGHLFLFECNLD